MKKITSGEFAGDARGITSGGGLPGSAPLGATEEAAAKSASGVKYFSDIRDRSTQAVTSKTSLQNLRDAATQFRPGLKTGWNYMLNKLAVATGHAPPGTMAEAAAQEDFNKLASVYIGDQIIRVGGGSDMARDIAKTGSPNELMTREGILGVTGLMMGLADAERIKNAVAQNWLKTHKSADSGAFEADWQKAFNPRVFQAQYMTPAQSKTMQANMSDAERKKFAADYKLSLQRGWIK